VTGGGEGTEKANHGGHGEKQTTEGTEDTQKSKPQRGRAATKQVWRHKNLRARKRIYGLVVQRTRRTRRKTNHGGHGDGKRGGRLEVERAVMRATPPVLAAVGVSNSPTAAERVALPARPPAWQAWRLAPQGTAPFREHERAPRSDEKGRTRWSAPTRHSIGLSRGRWVKGGQGRLESRPQARKPAPQQMLAPKQEPEPQRGCPTSECLHHRRGGDEITSQPPARLPVWQAGLLAPREHPVWHARLRAPRRGRHGKPGGLLHANIRCGKPGGLLHVEQRGRTRWSARTRGMIVLRRAWRMEMAWALVDGLRRGWQGGELTRRGGVRLGGGVRGRSCGKWRRSKAGRGCARARQNGRGSGG